MKHEIEPSTIHAIILASDKFKQDKLDAFKSVISPLISAIKQYVNMYEMKGILNLLDTTTTIKIVPITTTTPSIHDITEETSLLNNAYTSEPISTNTSSSKTLLATAGITSFSTMVIALSSLIPNTTDQITTSPTAELLSNTNQSSNSWLSTTASNDNSEQLTQSITSFGLGLLPIATTVAIGGVCITVAGCYLWKNYGYRYKTVPLNETTSKV